MIRSHLVQLLSEKSVAENLISRPLPLILNFVIDRIHFFLLLSSYIAISSKKIRHKFRDGRAEIERFILVVYRCT